jgi:hypothetical protein
MEVYLHAYVILTPYVSDRIHYPAALKLPVPTGWTRGQSGQFGGEREDSV